jgi:hypothetical protein
METGEPSIDAPENDSLAKEVSSHYILHWNYRGYERIPPELGRHGSHVQELYFKENGLRQIPGLGSIL